MGYPGVSRVRPAGCRQRAAECGTVAAALAEPRNGLVRRQEDDPVGFQHFEVRISPREMVYCLVVSFFKIFHVRYGMSS